ncbi:MAG TPA: hypothetical protein VMF66_20870 [Candidatus Acidoferrum sp.]|nr:hypothetical protein [Candidatus Acidoferrum sp.]
MMIDFRKSEIFEWKMPQTIDGSVGSDLSLPDLFEQLADGFGVQRSVLGRWSLAISRPHSATLRVLA